LTVRIVRLHTVQLWWLIELRFEAVLTDVVDMAGAVDVVGAVDVGVHSKHFIAT